jgi:membrane-bound ClpP family serine protease
METLLYWGIGLLALAVVLLVVEVFVPTGGFIGVTATCLAIAGCICLFKVDWRWGAFGLLAIGVIGPTIVYLGLQVFPSTPMGRKILNLPPEYDPESGPPPSPAAEFEALIDAEGSALTDLRPGGFVRLEHKRVAAMSEISFIPAGTRVRVTGADGMGVRVRPVA